MAQPKGHNQNFLKHYFPHLFVGVAPTGKFFARNKAWFKPFLHPTFFSPSASNLAKQQKLVKQDCPFCPNKSEKIFG